MRLIFVFLLLTTLPAAEASANCFVDCMSASGCWSSRSDENVSYCSGTEARCETECRNGGAEKKSYGAIAYSVNNEAFGWSHGWDDQKQAEQTALENCSKHGTGCEIQVWFYNNCAAVAADGESVSWALNASESKAKTQALEKCAGAGGRNCSVKTSHCSR